VKTEQVRPTANRTPIAQKKNNASALDVSSTTAGAFLIHRQSRLDRRDWRCEVIAVMVTSPSLIKLKTTRRYQMQDPFQSDPPPRALAISTWHLGLPNILIALPGSTMPKCQPASVSSFFLQKHQAASAQDIDASSSVRCWLVPEC
jgi:hypothetical protein